MTTFIITRIPYPPGLPRIETEEDGITFRNESYKLILKDRSANNSFFKTEAEKIIDFGSRTPFTRVDVW